MDINEETNIVSAHECTVETHTARDAHSINGCRQTHRDRQSQSVRWTGFCCAPLSQDNTHENIHTPAAVTCLHCYILLYIESFSQLAPKNKHSSVCPHRWTRRTGRHGQRQQTCKAGTHWKPVPSQAAPVTFTRHCWPFHWVTSCSADMGCHSLYATVLRAWHCRFGSNSHRVRTIVSVLAGGAAGHGGPPECEPRSRYDAASATSPQLQGPPTLSDSQLLPPFTPPLRASTLGGSSSGLCWHFLHTSVSVHSVPSLLGKGKNTFSFQHLPFCLLR